MSSEPNRPSIKTVDRKWIPVKTAKGQEEIRTKACRLPARLRRLLIMVDGQSTIGETIERLAGLDDDLETHFSTLLAEGFLAPRDAVPSIATALSEQPEFNLAKAKGFARFVILGVLGPAGARRAQRIEAASTPGELRAELDDLRDALPALLSKRQAKDAWDQLEPLMLSISIDHDPSPD
ncbi:hypothetical protein [Thiobaca trueperi]|uniref:Uncharacterized protein n=1 Tax=Thiobaca trueperi TaxID=127458 RepID=A0A4R3N415_9GAMM|nr:hypothetical protein [Thiobaca trueperi]TCT23898.1 hypothetical protein EDC35_101212 [Thiobaca trueperi]